MTVSSITLISTWPIKLMAAWPIVVANAISILAAWWFPWALVIPLIYIALLAHEIAHAVMFRRQQGVPSEIAIALLAKGKTKALLTRNATPRERIAMALAGPCTGIAVGIFVIALACIWVSWPFIACGAYIVGQHAFNLTTFVAGSDGNTIRDALREMRETP